MLAPTARSYWPPSRTAKPSLSLQGPITKPRSVDGSSVSVSVCVCVCVWCVLRECGVYCACIYCVCLCVCVCVFCGMCHFFKNFFNSFFGRLKAWSTTLSSLLEARLMGEPTGSFSISSLTPHLPIQYDEPPVSDTKVAWLEFLVFFYSVVCLFFIFLCLFVFFFCLFVCLFSEILIHAPHLLLSHHKKEAQSLRSKIFGEFFHHKKTQSSAVF